MINKCVLLLGGSEDQLFIINTAHEMGLQTAVVDANKYAPGLKLASFSNPIDFSDIPKILSYVKELCNRGVNVCGVTTMGSDVPHIVAEIARYFGWVGPSIKTSKIATNKYKMKNCFSKAGIPIPKFSLVKFPKEVLMFWKKWGCEKVILKPTDRAGSRGVRLITSSNEADDSFMHALENSHKGQVLLEEYINGPQISTESIIFNEKSSTPGFADRVYEGMESFWPQIMENGGWVPSKVDDVTKKEVIKLVEDSARTIGIKRGVAKGDVVIHPQKGPIMIEMAARLSGGDFSESLVPLECGVNYVKAALKITVGEEPDWNDLQPKFQKTVANRYFFLPPGQLKNIKGIKTIKQLNRLKKFRIFYKIGDIIPKIQSHGERVGVMVIVGDKRDEVQYFIDKAYSLIKFKVDNKWYSGDPRHYH